MKIKCIRLVTLFGILALILQVGSCKHRSEPKLEKKPIVDLSKNANVEFGIRAVALDKDQNTVWLVDEHTWVHNDKEDEWTASPLKFSEGDANKLAYYGILSIIPKNSDVKSLKIESPDGLANKTVTEPDKDSAGVVKTPKEWTMVYSIKGIEQSFKVTVTSADGSVTDVQKIKVINPIKIPDGKELPVLCYVDGEFTQIQFDSITNTKTASIYIKDPNKTEFELKAEAIEKKIFKDPDYKDILVGINEKGTTYFDKKTIQVSDASCTINVGKDGMQTPYTLKIVTAKKSCKLKNLELDLVDRFAFEPNMFEYNNIPLPVNQDLKVTATAVDSAASITVNDKPVNDSGEVTLSSFAGNKITVKVTNGGESQDYLINTVQAAAKVTLDVTVVSAMGGTFVNDTTLQVFKAGTTEQVGSDYTVTDGKVEISNLTANTKYDFVLIGVKGKRAGSRIENYYIGAQETQRLTMMQYKHGQIGRDVIPPKITEVLNGSLPGASKIEDGITIGSDFTSIYIKTLSPSAMIKPVEGGSSYGIKVGLGVIPHIANGISPDYYPDPWKFTDTSEGFQQEFNFGLQHTKLPKGKTDLIIVAYDTANNRVEKHIWVNFDQALTDSTLEFAEFSNLTIKAEKRCDENNWLYSVDDYNDQIKALEPVNGKNPQYLLIATFDLKENGAMVPLLGFELYRKEVGGSFERVSRRLYGKAYTPASGKSFLGIDSDSLLEDGKEYEYKFVAFNATSSKESPVIKTKLLPSFEYNLTSPTAYQVITKANADTMDYSCTVSNPDVLKEADYIQTGLLVMDKQGGKLFGIRCRYIFAKSTTPADIIVITKNGNTSVAELVANLPDGHQFKNLKANDLMTVDSGTGVITFTNLFTKLFGGNHEYKAGVAYQWDILDWGENPYSLKDDNTMKIVKVWEDTALKYSTASTLGNIGTSAVNGRLEFTVE